MSYAHPEVLVDTEWVSQNPPNENRKLVEVDYDPVNGYQKGHINGASLIWWKRDINDPVTRDIINKKQFEDLMSKNGITSESGFIPFFFIKSSNCFLLMISRVMASLMSRFHQIKLASLM